MIEKLIIFILLIVGILSFITIVNTGNTHYLKISNDSNITSGIQDQNSTAFKLVNETTSAIGESLPTGFWIVFLIPVVFLIFLIFYALKH
jgi:hypothetical protein